MEIWIPLVLFYGLAKGAREGLKKKALEKSSVMEVLFFHAVIALILLLPFSKGIFEVTLIQHLLIFVKSFVIFIAWICAFNSIKKMPVSFYGVIDMARVLFSTVLALLFLGETMTLPKGIGLLLVLSGIVIVNIGNSDGERVRAKYLLISLLSCLLNAISGFMDKKLLSGDTLDSSKLQFWYMFYLTLLYGLYILFTKTKLSLTTVKSNYWIVILSVLFVIADRALFIANEDPNSQVTIMTLIKQSSVLVTVFCGKVFFKEKHTLKRAVCAAIVITGIVIATI